MGLVLITKNREVWKEKYGLKRKAWLDKLYEWYPFVISLSADGKNFTKWLDYKDHTEEQILYSPEIHREILPNEILIETDYEDVGKNRLYATLIRKEIRFSPVVKFSGGKSFHMSYFFDFKKLNKLIDDETKLKIEKRFGRKKFLKLLKDKVFKKYFLTSIYAQHFDTMNENNRHLIRCVFSLNKMRSNSVPYDNQIKMIVDDVRFSYNEIVDGVMLKFIKEILDTPVEVYREAYSRFEGSKKSLHCLAKIKDGVVLTDGKKRMLFALVSDCKKIGVPRQNIRKELYKFLEANKVSDTQVEGSINSVYNQGKYLAGRKFTRKLLEELGLLDFCNSCGGSSWCGTDKNFNANEVLDGAGKVS